MFRELEAQRFTIIAVAFDTGGADDVRAYIRPADPIVVPAPMRAIMGWSDDDYARAAPPAYPCLIDERHLVAEAYGMTNVPMAAWIDEDGRIVRPAEPAGATDGFRALDRTTFTLDPEIAAAGRASRERYVAAIRDWVLRGAESRYAQPEPQSVATQAPSADVERGIASFHLAQYFRARGDSERAQTWFNEAKRLGARNWTIFRQALHLEQPGNASGPEFLQTVRDLGNQPYYPPITFAGDRLPG